MLLILDIDGTIADNSHRLHWIEREKPDWDTFLSPDLVAKDIPIPEAQEALDKIFLQLKPYSLHVVTGRNESLRDVTELWLDEHFGIGPSFTIFDSMTMRPRHNNTTSSSYKEAVLANIIESRGQDFGTALIIDDDPWVLSMAEEFGITLKAPDCWKLFLTAAPGEKEALWAK
jgi:hypothetical protein